MLNAFLITKDNANLVTSLLGVESLPQKCFTEATWFIWEVDGEYKGLRPSNCFYDEFNICNTLPLTWIVERR